MKFRPNKTMILSGEDIEAVLRQCGLNPIMDALILRLRKAIETFNPENTFIPVRSGFNYTQPEPGLIEWMPLLKSGEQAMIKIVSYHPKNPDQYGLPTILSTFSAYDTSTGHLMGITDGVLLTALRTGAASAIATDILAHPESKVLGLIGCGAQAITQLHAISRIRPIQKVFLYDIDADSCLSFSARAAVMNLDVEFLPCSLEQVVEASDILVTATSIDVGKGPLFKHLNTKDHLHVNAVGSDFPGKIELPLELLKQSLVCPDFPAQAMKEGECQQLSETQIGPDFVHIVQHAADFDERKYSRTVFDSTGWPLEDQIVMELFLEHASLLGLGKEIDIEYLQEDAKNPYGFVEKSQRVRIVR